MSSSFSAGAPVITYDLERPFLDLRLDQGRSRHLRDLLDRGPVPAAALYSITRKRRRLREERKWIDRERKLRTSSSRPRWSLVWCSGLHPAYIIGAWSMGWFPRQFLIVLLLSGYHGYMVGLRQEACARRAAGERQGLRIMNEIPGSPR
jgi:hypothetical protein